MSCDGKRWLLLNCSPDVASQIESFPALHPKPPRVTPIAGMLLTDANVDHIGGLATLRQHGDYGFTLRSSGVVRALATAQPAFAPFSLAPHRWLEVPLDGLCPSAGDDDLVGERRLSVRALAVPGTTPGYDGRRTPQGAVVAYDIRAGESRLLFAPVFAEIDATLRQAVSAAHLAFLDGSFYSDNELIAQGLLTKPARSLGHLPVGGPDGTLSQLRDLSTRIIFTHLNNSNPMLDPNSAAYARVREAGAEVAHDGMELHL